MNQRSITVARDAGFCLGVRRAIDIARQTATDHQEVAMLGDIVHNEGVVADLREIGIRVYNDVDDIPKEVPVIFRSHGTGDDIWERARQRDLTIIDATCPLVREIHEAARELAEEQRRIIIIGDPGHDEVVAIASQIDNPIIVANEDDVIGIPTIKSAGVVIQSTQYHENVNAIIARLIMKINDLRIINTICKPTRNRQNQVRELAEANDVTIIVGSFTSANTKRLTMIAKSINPNSYQVQEAGDLQAEWFRNMKSVGISAGASTPDELVREVQEKISALPI